MTGWKGLLLPIAFAAATAAAQPSQTLPVAEPPHDAASLDDAGIGSAIATPLPPSESRRLRHYEIPELAGSRQALGSQLIDGKLPKPVVDYIAQQGSVTQRLSLFEGGLVVVQMTGAGANLRKRLLLPADAAAVYTRALSAEGLQKLPAESLMKARPNEDSLLRVYRDDGTFVERHFSPSVLMPKTLSDQVAPLQDLIRAVSIDREVTNSVANYEPSKDDLLVGDDSRVYRVMRVFGTPPIVELRCVNQPTSIYVAKKDLYNYFIGRRESTP